MANDARSPFCVGLLAAMAVPVLVVDGRGAIREANPAAVRLLDLPEAHCGTPLLEYLRTLEYGTGAAMDAALEESLAARRPLDSYCNLRAPRDDGDRLCHLVVKPFEPGDTSVVTIQQLDRVADLVRFLEHRARAQSLATLLEREPFVGMLEQLLARASGGGVGHALLHVTLAMPAQAQQTAQQLTGAVVTACRGLVRSRDVLALLSPTAYGLLLDACPAALAARVAARLRSDLRTALAAEDDAPRVEVGVCVSGPGVRGALDWIQQAARAGRATAAALPRAAAVRRPSERRRAPRCLADVSVFLLQEGFPVGVGSIHDASGFGLGVVTAPALSDVGPGTRLEVSIGLQRGGVTRRHRLPARVVHALNERLGLQIDLVDAHMREALESVIPGATAPSA